MARDFGEEAKCKTCRKPKALSTKNQEAISAFYRLSSRRVWDGSSGLPRPLALSEIRAEAEFTADKIASVDRIIILDTIWLDFATKKHKKEMEKRKNASHRNRH